MFGQTPLSNLSLGRVGRDLVALILSSWDFSLSLLRQHNNFHFIRMFISASLFCMNLLSIPQQTRPRSRIEALWVTQPKPHITRVTFLSLFDPLQRRLNKASAELHISWNDSTSIDGSLPSSSSWEIGTMPCGCAPPHTHPAVLSSIPICPRFIYKDISSLSPPAIFSQQLDMARLSEY